MRKIIAVDFDGTLCTNKFPEIGVPNYNVIVKLLEEKVAGTAIILWTCRGGDYLKDAILWCADHGITFDAINDNVQEAIDYFGGTNSRKVFANEYWDDKAVLIKGGDLK